MIRIWLHPRKATQIKELDITASTHHLVLALAMINCLIAHVLALAIPGKLLKWDTLSKRAANS